MRVSRAHFVRAPLQESAISASLASSTTVATLPSQSGPPLQQARAGTRLVLASSSGQAMRCVSVVHISCVRLCREAL
jgi:hypothetical protein